MDSWLEVATNEHEGTHYQVLKESEINSEFGPVHWKSVLEYVGSPILDTETTLVEVDGRTVYKAKRIFQESYPAAGNVRVKDGLIEWEDGEYSFSLRMQTMGSGTHTAPAHGR